MSNMEQKFLVLIVDADPGTHRFLGPALEASSYRVASAMTIEEGLAAMVMRPPDAVILETAFPNYEGPDVLGRALEAHTGPIIVISAVEGDQAKTAAINAGAYDLIEKPFMVGDLIGRLQEALAHRHGPAKGVRIKTGRVEIDLERQLVEADRRPVKLTAREYELLSLLALSRGRVVTHGQLVDALWREPHSDSVQHLRVLVGNLRQKIEADASSPGIILTVPGVGYRFMVQIDQDVGSPPNPAP